MRAGCPCDPSLTQGSVFLPGEQYQAPWQEPVGFGGLGAALAMLSALLDTCGSSHIFPKTDV